jgi:hypothetical protein
MKRWQNLRLNNNITLRIWHLDATSSVEVQELSRATAVLCAVCSGEKRHPN